MLYAIGQDNLEYVFTIARKYSLQIAFYQHLHPEVLTPGEVFRRFLLINPQKPGVAEVFFLPWAVGLSATPLLKGWLIAQSYLASRRIRNILRSGSAAPHSN